MRWYAVAEYFDPVDALRCWGAVDARTVDGEAEAAVLQGWRAGE